MIDKIHAGPFGAGMGSPEDESRLAELWRKLRGVTGEVSEFVGGVFDLDGDDEEDLLVSVHPDVADAIERSGR